MKYENNPGERPELFGRRDVLALLGGSAAAWPLAARAQQKTIPVVGFLSPLEADSPASAADIARLRKGLAETGFVEGQQVAIEYRYANNRLEQLPALAADLVARHVDVIVTTGGPPPIKAAVAATASIPIVFVLGTDPVKNKFVPNLNRPGGNVTGITFFATELAAKRLELLREMVPKAARIGVLNDPAFPLALDPSATPGAQLIPVAARSETAIDAAFASLAAQHADALFVGNGSLLNTEREKIVALAARYAIPASYELPGFVELGGLMSYGASVGDAVRQAGAYAGKILNGAKPGDLPVLQPTIFDLAINLKTAKALGISVPLSLQVSATEVIE